MHDPTTQEPPGQRRRHAVPLGDLRHLARQQRKVAEEVKARVDKSGKWKSPIVTEIVDAGPFTPAEDYHQDYLAEEPRRLHLPLHARLIRAPPIG